MLTDKIQEPTSIQLRVIGRSLEVYAQDIGEYGLISREEEENLARRIQLGDKKARNKLVEANLRFVWTIANEYYSGRTPLEDLISYGNLGLIAAAERFNPKKARFITYGVWWIRQTILQGILEQRTVRLPNNRVDKLSDILELQGLGLNNNQISEELSLTQKQLDRYLLDLRNPLSLDQPINEDNQHTLSSIIPDFYQKTPEEELLEADMKEAVREALATLEEREAEVIRLNFGLDNYEEKSLEDISKQFSLTKERIRQIRNKALEKLRHSKRASILQRCSPNHKYTLPQYL